MGMSMHAKYPSMERQDLSQGQLGAFKFTPVDGDTHYCPQPLHHPLLYQQYAQSMQSPGVNLNFPTEMTITSPRPETNTLAMVNGIAQYEEALMRPTAQSFQPFHLDSSGSESLPSIYASESNGAAMSEAIMFNNTNASLVKALEVEQEAHEATKLQLHQQIIAQQDAEAEIVRMADHNKALLNSIKLLQSTVKHMVQKERQSEKVLADEPHTSRKDSILYDAFNQDYRTSPQIDQEDKKPTTTDSEQLSQAVEDESALVERVVPDLPIRLKDHSQNIAPEQQATDQSTVQDEAYSKSKNVLARQDEEVVTATVPVVAKGSDGHKIDKNAVFPLSLPQSWLEKYGTRQVSSSSHTNYKNLCATPVHTSIHSAKRDMPPIQVYDLADSPNINWKLDARQVLDLRNRHIVTDGRSHFIDHPVRYVPSMTEPNLFRTIMIDFIPFGTPYSDVLSQIRGGSLESIHLYGPIGDATDFVTARVVFVHETGASTLFRRGQDPGVTVNGQRVRVWQVLEPTYPKTREMEDAIYENGHTRILIVNAPRVDVEPLLKRKLRRQIEAGLVLDIGTSHDDLPIVEFTSVEDATRALDRFLDDPDFAGADFDFDDDPCAANY